MAMKICDEYHHDRVFMRHWEQLCDKVDLSFTAFKKILFQHYEELLIAMDAERDDMQQKGIDTITADRIIRFVKDDISRQL